MLDSDSRSNTIALLLDMPPIETKIVSYEDFEDLIMELRLKVFVDEQEVDPKLEIDGIDPDCIHAIALDGAKIVACGRMQKDGHIGRVAVEKNRRRQGVGKSIMDTLHEEAKRRGIKELWLGSQVSATAFYENLGYTTRGEIFVEANIDHILMAKKLS